MGSLTIKTETKRKATKRKQGRKRKVMDRSKGSTPKFAIHVAEDKK